MIGTDARLTDALFSATYLTTNQLEPLANQALTKGIDLYMAEDYTAAAKEFKRATGLYLDSPNGVSAAHYQALTQLKLDNVEGAIKAYQGAVEIHPNRDDVRIYLGNLYYTLGRYGEAAEQYQAATRVNPDSSNHYALGQAYLSLGEHSNAEREFNTVKRLSPDKADGDFGLGSTYRAKGRLDEALRYFQAARDRNPDLAEAVMQIGEVYADQGQMDQAQRMVDALEYENPDLADSLSRYMYRVDPPKIVFASAEGTFNTSLPANSPVYFLDAYLADADRSKIFSMTFQFDKKMDRSSVEDVYNWQISRSTRTGPVEAYNLGRTVPDTDATITPYPVSVYYDTTQMMATVRFYVHQNTNADATLDPGRIEFKFSGEDIYGYQMSEDHDSYTGFSGVA